MGVSVQSILRLFVGEPLPSTRAAHQRLIKLLALPVFASDAISSSAYATEEILLALVVAGASGLLYSPAVALAIAFLFAIVAVSYRQTILAYPSGGGAYIVARENLGVYPGLIAAAALLTDYVLTVAVSIAAGVAAIISAFPGLVNERVLLCILFILFITLMNMRGAKESGKLFAPPVYLFIGSVALMVIVGAVRALLGHTPEPVAEQELAATQPLTIFLLLRAFASGCAALTGIEAISNGVPAFRPPESKNASITLLWMTAVCIVLFVGITGLTQAFHVLPDESARQTVLSMLGRQVFGSGFLYYVLQASTAAILILAANTSFADFPRLSSILARDGFAPRQLANLGDRLVFANGILLLGFFSCILVAFFHGLTHALIPLYAVGVFISFTLSQAGMVVHWRRLRSRNWQIPAAVNALGCVVTGIVLVVVASVKFTHGAWIVLLIIPVVLLAFQKISQHYRQAAAALSMKDYTVPRGCNHSVVVLVPGLHKGVAEAVAYAKTLADEVEAVYVETAASQTKELQEQWARYRLDLPLTVLPSPWRSIAEPVIKYVRNLRAERHLDLVTVVLPEFGTTRWWHPLLHNQTGLLLKYALMFEPGVVVVNYRYQLEE